MAFKFVVIEGSFGIMARAFSNFASYMSLVLAGCGSVGVRWFIVVIELREGEFQKVAAVPKCCSH